MTRAALGMHIIAKTPPAKCLKSVDAGNVAEFADFSQLEKQKIINITSINEGNFFIQSPPWMYYSIKAAGVQE